MSRLGKDMRRNFSSGSDQVPGDQHEGSSAAGAATAGQSIEQRVDKWLWAARFFKTRTLAAEAVAGGHVKVDGQRIKPSKPVRADMRRKIKRLLRKHGYPPDQREEAVATVIEQAEAVCRDWAENSATPKGEA